MVREEKIRLPNGVVTTKGEAAFWIGAHYFGDLAQFYSRGVNGSLPEKPEDACWELHLMLGSSQRYLDAMRDLRQFSSTNPMIKLAVDVLEERVGEILEIAKKAPAGVQEATGIAYLVQQTALK